MTDSNKTLIAALLDRSGSMNTSKEATEDGWRELINGQRQQPGRFNAEPGEQARRRALAVFGVVVVV